jgi:hypothetical protein
VINRVLIVVQMIVIIFHMVVIIGENLTTPYGSEANKVWIKVARYSTIGWFSLFLVVYLAVFFILTRRLKQYFPKFYEKERMKIFVANGCIILAIIMRILLNIWYLNNMQEVNDSYNNNTWLFPMY